MNWMVLPLRRYAEFSGRSRRKEYWMFVLFNIIVGIVTTALDALLGFDFGATGPLNALASLALLVPGIAVAVRRLHDTDRSGWWFLLIFVPILGWIALLVFYCLDGTRGPNRFGPDPKELADFS
jgi:uncharacterized membrane protein YhaH (DUF805 family)